MGSTWKEPNSPKTVDALEDVTLTGLSGEEDAEAEPLSDCKLMVNVAIVFLLVYFFSLKICLKNILFAAEICFP